MSGDKSSSVQPTVLWAQVCDKLFITMSVSDVKDHVLDIKENSLHFTAKAGHDKVTNYEANLEFFGQVSAEDQHICPNGREIVISIKKKEPGYWPRLLSQTTKFPWLKTDFNRMKDEDDSEPEMDNNFGNMLSGMSNFDDFGADDGVDADLDSDDEDLETNTEETKE